MIDVHERRVKVQRSEAQNSSSLILEGYDAGASFRSTHLPETLTTVTVLGNSSEGAWPAMYALADAMDGPVRGKFPDET